MNKTSDFFYSSISTVLFSFTIFFSNAFRLLFFWYEMLPDLSYVKLFHFFFSFIIYFMLNMKTSEFFKFISWSFIKQEESIEA